MPPGYDTKKVAVDQATCDFRSVGHGIANFANWPKGSDSVLFHILPYVEQETVYRALSTHGSNSWTVTDRSQGSAISRVTLSSAGDGTSNTLLVNERYSAGDVDQFTGAHWGMGLQASGSGAAIRRTTAFGPGTFGATQWNIPGINGASTTKIKTLLCPSNPAPTGAATLNALTVSPMAIQPTAPANWLFFMTPSLWGALEIPTNTIRIHPATGGQTFVDFTVFCYMGRPTVATGDAGSVHIIDVLGATPALVQTVPPMTSGASAPPVALQRVELDAQVITGPVPASAPPVAVSSVQNGMSTQSIPYPGVIQILDPDGDPDTAGTAFYGRTIDGNLTAFLIGPQPNATGQPPTLSPIGNQTVLEGRRLTVSLNATDLDLNDMLTFTVTGLPPGATLQNLGNGRAELTYIPGFNDSQTFTITVRVTDSGTPSRSDEQQFQLTVVDTPPPTLIVNGGALSVTVNEAAGTINVPVILSGTIDLDVIFAFSTGDGSAIGSTDYTPQTGSVRIPATQSTAMVSVPILNDALDETNETFSVRYTGVTNVVTGGIGNDTVTVTIVDNDDPPTLTINGGVNAASVAENAGFFSAILMLSQPSGQDINFTLLTADGTATSGSDYAASSRTVTIPAGQQTANFVADIFNDVLDEPDETFTVRVTGLANVVTGPGNDVLTVTVVDDDPPSGNRPPDVSRARPAVTAVWPPLGIFIPVAIVGISDPDGDRVSVEITGIRQDEPTGRSRDAFGVGSPLAWIRLERLDSGNGRIYEIRFVARDGRGGETPGTVTVGVLRQPGRPPVDDGIRFDSTVPGASTVPLQPSGDSGGAQATDFRRRLTRNPANTTSAIAIAPAATTSVFDGPPTGTLTDA
jgi:hypothetical protein